ESEKSRETLRIAPLGEQPGLAQVERERPDDEQRSRDRDRYREPPRVTPASPRREERQDACHKRYYRRTERAATKKRRADGEAEQRAARERAAQYQREGIQCERIEEQSADLRRELMSAIPEADAADEQQYREPTESTAVELARRQRQKPQRCSEAQTERDAGPVVQRQHIAKRLRGRGRERVK